MSGQATTRRQTSSRLPDRKGSITRESARLFAERGFSAVGMDDIGAAVGITGPAIYRHFSGKDAVLEAVVLELLGEFTQRADAETTRVPSDADLLAELVAGSVSVALDHPAEVATYVRERRRLTREAARRAGELERGLRTIWAGVLRQESSAMSGASIVLRQQAVLGAMGSMTIQRGGLTRPRLDQLLVDGSLRMLRAEPAAPAPPSTRPPSGSAWQPQVSRREAILNAALGLMRAKGYHGVAIDEIGDAAGISGPAVYRHYASKADILLDAYDRVGSRVAVGVEAALAAAMGPSDALARLIDSYVTIAIDNVDLIIATGQEGAALPDAERPRLARQRRDIAESWIRVVGELRPDLTEAEVRRHVASAFPMVNHVAQFAAGPIDPGPELRDLVWAFLAGRKVNAR
jgi:AcrR family transcriptional regulator